MSDHEVLASDDSDDRRQEAVPAPTKTPFYQAFNAVRYQRQAVIKLIEVTYNRQLICYVAGINTSIDRDDPVKFVDLLHNVRSDEAVDLLLHTPGGDIDSAEKIMKLVRSRVGDGRLRVIVPDYAKSSGTLMVLAADSVVMSDTSELGPIDPQVALSDGTGRRWHSVNNYLDAYKEHSIELKKDPTNVVAQLMLDKINPATLKLFQATQTRAQRIAEDHLKLGMFKEKGNWSLAATTLINTDKWPSHGQMISWQDAQAPDLGLVVEYLESDCEEWQLYWQLYCLQRIAIGDDCKLFESNFASLLVPG
jgi:ClpP class serine protease